MRSIAGALVLVVALGCPKRDDTQASSSTARALPSPSGSQAWSASSAGVAPSSPAEGGSAFLDRPRERRILVDRLRQDGIADERVLSAMARVPRHAFVPEAAKARAYANEPLPIGYGQTISQPIVVAAMTAAARPGREDKCLESRDRCSTNWLRRGGSWFR